MFLLIAGGVLYEHLGKRRDARRFQPPGRYVPADGCELHLHEGGAGEPTVVLESGIAASSSSWAHVQPLISRFTKVASYDRNGLGWSGRCRLPENAAGLERHVKRLSELLQNAGCLPPFILVGHSFGGLLIRAFAHAYPDKVVGLVFVDPVSIGSWAPPSETDRRRLAVGVRLSKRGAWLARFGVVRFALSVAAGNHRRLTKAIANASAGTGTSTLERLVGEICKLPPELIPVVRAQWSQAKCFLAMADHLQSLPNCAAEAAEMPIPLHMHFIVLSAASATEAEKRERESWVAGSKLGCHFVVEETGHWLHLERPDAVARAVQELVERWREESRVRERD